MHSLRGVVRGVAGREFRVEAVGGIYCKSNLVGHSTTKSKRMLLTEVLPLEGTGADDNTLTTSIGRRDGENVSSRKITDVYPDISADICPISGVHQCDYREDHLPIVREILIAERALDNHIPPDLGRLVQVLRLVNLVEDRAENEWRVQDCDVPSNLVLVLAVEVPCGALGESLACAVLVDRCRVLALLVHLPDRTFVPVCFVEHLYARAVLENGCTRCGDNDALDGRAVLQCRLEDAERALHGGDNVIVRVFTAEVEG